ncbi:unnamed protein product [Vitrella brassicaformis CCMP3155]|uniref:Uncharacterized protein n=1 Tax=Vitrella brassicaformis (strain CCMP3155) TaxID=1169540 RepID=A0A0G4GUT6_VITBC|nr:unnamed protein product [Vitrella brassicaformis CCMP3155]|eukprot:CEM34580.1 unnamed protein product [Vitrella brassicaformis CCMP3155]
MGNGLPHQDMPGKCDGERPNGARCGADFTVQHALGCSLGGLVYAKHDRLKHKVGGLCQLAGLKVAYEHTVWKETAHTAAARDPRAVPLGVTPCDGAGHPHPSPPLPTHLTLRTRPTHTLHPTSLMVSTTTPPSARTCSCRGFGQAAASCGSISALPTLTLAATGATGAITREREKLKRDHHLDVCRLNRMDFTAFIVTCDGVYGREADRFIRRLAELINKRGGWDRYGTGRVEQWIRARLSVCLARSVSACLRRPRRKGRWHWLYQRGRWGDGAGMFVPGEPLVF